MTGGPLKRPQSALRIGTFGEQMMEAHEFGDEGI